jgi:hypothetical protein
VEPGEDVQVTIAVSNYGGAGAISEMLPSEFTFKESSLTRRGSGQELRFILTGQTSLMYTATASSVEDSYTFSGVLKRVGEPDFTIGGPSSVTVEAASGSTPSAERSFDDMTVEPGEEGRLLHLRCNRCHRRPPTSHRCSVARRRSAWRRTRPQWWW